MKNVRNINTRNLVLTLMILAGVTVSCEKEQFDQPSEEHAGRVIITSMNDDRGGDDEEEPIVHGVVETGNGIPVTGATVKIFEFGSNTASDTETTNINGEFEMVVPVGSYFFKVTVGGSTTTTNTIIVNNDLNVVIIV